MSMKNTNFEFIEVNPTLTADEIFAFLTDSVEPTFTVASANPAAHTGAMIALVPSKEDLARLAVDGGEPLEELHLTLAYLGEAALISEEQRRDIIDAAGGYFTDAVNTEAFSVNVFNPHNPEMETAIVLGIKGEPLVDNHSNVMSAVRGVYGAMPDNHRPWIPHVTLKYTDDLRKEDQEIFLSRLGGIKFDTLRFAFGGETTDIPLYDADQDDSEVLTAAAMPRQLKKYWLGPEGSKRVGGWGNEGSFTACQREMRKEGVPARQVDGLCANLYRAATGHSPGRKKEEAAMTASVEVNELVDVSVEEQRYATWEGILTVEGVESGDGRMFRFGSLDWAHLPEPLMYQPANTGGHSGSVLVGQIQNVYRRGNQVWGSGIIDLMARYNGENIGQEVFRLLDEGLMNGVSVDVDKVKDADVELIFSEDAGPMSKPRMTIFNRGRIRGATMVAFPAFVEARIFLTGDRLTASAVGEILVEVLDEEVPLTASAHTISIPDVPPAEWFEKPTDVTMKGALTVTDEGRVFGRLAPAGVTHRSINRKVPMGVDYTRFLGAETIVAGGSRVVTGPVTMNCGHAPTEGFGTLEMRREHYDNTCSVVANINVGEDADGVWVAGALSPFATAEQVYAMMSCRLSGDWQPHPDRHGVPELIAALLVPVPGFASARKEASVTFEDGLLTASAIPVEFAESSALLVAGNRKKLMMAQTLGVDHFSRKMKMAKELGREGTGQDV